MADVRQKKNSFSIRNRLLLQLGILAFAISLSLYLLVRLVILQTVTVTQDGLLTASLQSIVDKIYVLDDVVSVDLPYDTFSLLGAVGEDRIFYRISENGKVLTGYKDFPYDGVYGNVRDPVFNNVNFLDEKYRVVAIEYSVFVGEASRKLHIMIAQSQNIQFQVLGKISNNLIFLVFVFFSFVLFIAYLTTQNAIKPINEFAKDVKKRRPNDLRKVSTDVPKELLPLSQSLNSFISRFRTTLRQTETFIAEAAHHVRTPLAIVKTESELALRKSITPENRVHLRNIIRAVDRTNRSASQLLDHAMVLYRAERPENQTFEIFNALTEVVKQFEPAANLKDLEFNFSSKVSNKKSISTDRTLWETAIRNLIDNAIKYAVSESVIDVSISDSKIGYEIKILNKIDSNISANPGLLFEKFKRGDGTKEIVGSGLGLSIVLEASNAMGATIKFRKVQEEAICAILSFS